MTKQELYGAIAMYVIFLVIGSLGSALEALGNKQKWPQLVAFGKKLEAIGTDGPKLAGKRAPDPEILKSEVKAEEAAVDSTNRGT